MFQCVARVHLLYMQAADVMIQRFQHLRAARFAVNTDPHKLISACALSLGLLITCIQEDNNHLPNLQWEMLTNQLLPTKEKLNSLSFENEEIKTTIHIKIVILQQYKKNKIDKMLFFIVQYYNNISLFNIFI